MGAIQMKGLNENAERRQKLKKAVAIGVASIITLLVLFIFYFFYFSRQGVQRVARKQSRSSGPSQENYLPPENESNSAKDENSRAINNKQLKNITGKKVGSEESSKGEEIHKPRAKNLTDMVQENPKNVVTHKSTNESKKDKDENMPKVDESTHKSDESTPIQVSGDLKSDTEPAVEESASDKASANTNTKLFKSSKCVFVKNAFKAFHAEAREYEKLVGGFAPLKELFDKTLEENSDFEDEEDPKMTANANDFILACFKFKLEQHLDFQSKLLTDSCAESLLKYKATAQNWLSWITKLKISTTDIDEKYAWMWFDDLEKAEEWCRSTSPEGVAKDKLTEFGKLIDLLKNLRATGKVSIVIPNTKEECTYGLFKEVVDELKAKDDLDNLEKVIRSFASSGLGQYAEQAGNIHLHLVCTKFFETVMNQREHREAADSAILEFDYKTKIQGASSFKEFLQIETEGFYHYRAQSIREPSLLVSYKALSEAIVESIMFQLLINSESEKVLDALESLRKAIKEDSYTASINQAYKTWRILALYATDATPLQDLYDICKNDSDHHLFVLLSDWFEPPGVLKKLHKLPAETTDDLLKASSLIEFVEKMKRIASDTSTLTSEDIREYLCALKSLRYCCFADLIDYLCLCFVDSCELASCLNVMKDILEMSLKTFPGQRDIKIASIFVEFAAFELSMGNFKTAQIYMAYSFRLEVIFGLELDDIPENAPIFDAYVAFRSVFHYYSTLSASFPEFLRLLHAKSPSLLKKYTIYTRCLRHKDFFMRAFIEAFPAITLEDLEKISNNVMLTESLRISLSNPSYFTFPHLAGLLDDNLLPYVYPDIELPFNFSFRESSKWDAYRNAFQVFVQFVDTLPSKKRIYFFVHLEASKFVPNLDYLFKHPYECTEGKELALAFEQLIAEIENDGHNPSLVTEMRKQLERARDLLKL